MTLSRRTTLQWLAAAAALPLFEPPALAQAGAAAVAPPFAVVDWPALPEAKPAPGYGRDPKLMEPSVPWPLTLDRAQRATLDLLGDLILPPEGDAPGAGKLGVAAFVDEWVSAPYPVQRADRERILPGLAWLDAQSRALGGRSFVALAPAQRTTLMDALMVATPAPRMVAPVAFMDKLRYLFVTGYYSLPEGKADMGYIGDQPTEGPYPGPTPEALAHLDRVLGELKLSPAVARS